MPRGRSSTGPYGSPASNWGDAPADAAIGLGGAGPRSRHHSPVPCVSATHTGPRGIRRGPRTSDSPARHGETVVAEGPDDQTATGKDLGQAGEGAEGGFPASRRGRAVGVMEEHGGAWAEAFDHVGH